MTWSGTFRRRQYLRSTLWVWPVIVTPPAFWQYSPSIATTMLSTIVGASAALTGFVVTVAVLVVQMAIGTFSARYMRLIYRDPVLKAVLALLIGTTTFSLSLLRRVKSDFVPDIGVTIDGILIVVGWVAGRRCGGSVDSVDGLGGTRRGEVSAWRRAGFLG